MSAVASTAVRSAPPTAEVVLELLEVVDLVLGVRDVVVLADVGRHGLLLDLQGVDLVDAAAQLFRELGQGG